MTKTFEYEFTYSHKRDGWTLFDVDGKCLFEFTPGQPAITSSWPGEPAVESTIEVGEILICAVKYDKVARKVVRELVVADDLLDGLIRPWLETDGGEESRMYDVVCDAGGER